MDIETIDAAAIDVWTRAGKVRQGSKDETLVKDARSLKRKVNKYKSTHEVDDDFDLWFASEVCQASIEVANNS